MAEIKIIATERTEFGKGAARRTRRAGLVPAVLYGHGMEPVHLTLPGHEMLLALRQANVLLEIDVEGGENYLAIPKQVQRDVIKGFVEHVDLLAVKRGEKVTVEVNVLLVGEAAKGTLVNQDLQTIALEVEATDIPTDIEVSIDGLEAGTQITAADLKLPKGAVFNGEPETLVVGINEAAQMDAGEAPEGEAAEAEATEAE